MWLPPKKQCGAVDLDFSGFSLSGDDFQQNLTAGPRNASCSAGHLYPVMLNVPYNANLFKSRNTGGGM
jgi:hypothetical protein